MKNLFAIILLTSIGLSASSQQYGWTDISANMPGNANYNDIQFIDEEVWITGWNDGLIYSPDGGETFQIQQLPENSGISSSIFMKNNLDGYVVTYNGNILKTDDGGTNWTKLHAPGGTLNSVIFPPTLDIGYTCGNNGKIYSFTDSSIVDMPVEGLTATLQSIFFPINNSEGKLCGNSTIRRWRDSTWNNMQIFDNTFVFNSIFFTDNYIGWVVGSQGKIFKTVDATIWNGQMSPTTKSLNGVFFIDSLEGWAAGSHVLLHTVDGGLNWTEEIASQTIGMELRAIYFTSAHKGYIVGNGVLLKYGEVSSIEDNGLEELAFEVFPNPCHDEITVRSSILDSRSSIFEVIDITGTVVLKNEFRCDGVMEYSVDVSHLPAGVYFVKLQTEDAVGVRKIIIQ